MRSIFSLFIVAFLAASASLGFAAEPAPKEQTKAKPDAKHSIIMEQKLKYTQQILAGLTNEDFAEIEKNAQILNTIGLLESWLRADSDAYRAQLKIYRFANDELIRLSKDKNLEGVSLAYVQLSLSCVNCHSHIRKTAK
jgi:hypothetical protein